MSERRGNPQPKTASAGSVDRRGGDWELPADEARFLKLHAGDDRQVVAKAVSVLGKYIVHPQAPAFGIQFERIQIVDEEVLRRTGAGARDELVPAAGEVELCFVVNRRE